MIFKELSNSKQFDSEILWVTLHTLAFISPFIYQERISLPKF